MALILLAENEAPTIDHIRSVLASQGWLVKTVGSRDQALRAASEFAPQLVLVNEQLSGAEDLVRTFSRRSGGPGVVLLTSGNGDRAQAAPESRGVDAVLPKPLQTDALIDTIRERLEASKDKISVVPTPGANRVYTSEEIFGDFLDDILDKQEPASTSPKPKAKPRPTTLEPVTKPERPAPEPPPRPDVVEAVADPEAQAEPDPTPDLVDLEEIVREEVEAWADNAQPTEGLAAAALEGSLSSFEDLSEQVIEGIVLDDESPSAAEPPSSLQPDSSMDDLQTRLNDTLAGVLADSLTAARFSDSTIDGADTESDSVDALLSKALSGLDLAAASADESQAVSAEPQSRSGPVEAPGDVEPPELADAVESEAPPDAAVAPDSPLPTPEEAAAHAAAPAELEGEEQASPPEAKPAATDVETDGEGIEFGDYRLEQRIGVGGMAEVWKARRQGVEGFEKRVAVKKILPQAAENEEFVEMFIDEAKLAAQLNHNNIAHIYDLGKIGSDYFIAMEYVEGKNLRQLLDRARKREQPIPLSVSLFIAARLAAALEYAHHSKDFDNAELGLVHRDVSPQNVLISFGGDIKLCDFGIAKAVSKISTTQIGALKGKLQYMSPEQAWGKSIDPRSDIFSLGALLFEMLSGEPLFTGESELFILEAVRACDVAARVIQSPRIPAGVKGLLLKALAKEPEDRFASAGDLQKGLEELLRGESAHAGPDELADFVQDLLDLEPAARPPIERPSTVEDPPEHAVRVSPEPATPGLTDLDVADLDSIIAETPPSDKPEDATPDKHWLRRVFTKLLPVLVVLAVGGGILAGLMQQEWASDPTPATKAPAINAAPAFQPEQVTRPEPTALESLPPPQADASTRAATPPPPQPAESQPEPSAASQQQESARPELDIEAARASLDAPRSSADLGGADDSDPRAGRETAPTSDLDLQRRVEEDLQRVQELMGSESGDAPRAGALETQTAPVAKDSGDPMTIPESSAGEDLGEGEELEAKVTADRKPLLAAVPIRQAPPMQLEPEPVEVPPEPATRRGDLVEPGPGVTRPQVVRFQQPAYTVAAQRLNARGTVRVSLLVDENGRVSDVRLLEGLSPRVGLNEAVLRAARDAIFEPATKDGVPVKIWHEMAVRFEP